MRSPGKPWKGNIARSSLGPNGSTQRQVIHGSILSCWTVTAPATEVAYPQGQSAAVHIGIPSPYCVKFSTCLPEFVHVREHGLAMIFNHSSFDGLFRYGQGGCLCRQLFLVTKDPLFAQVHSSSPGHKPWLHPVSIAQAENLFEPQHQFAGDV